MRTTAKQIHWPVRGVDESAAYHDATPDEARSYSSPFASNVRGRGPVELRSRGGSRPGLRVVTGVTTESGGRWLWSNGTPLLWPDGTNVTFSSDAVSFAPDGSTVIDLHAVPRVAATKGNSPSGASVATFYRARLFAASGSDWFCSRIGDVGDWDYGGDGDDPSRACAGNCAFAGVKGFPITAFMPVGDSHLYIATLNSLWCISGDPGNGTFSCVSEWTGVAGAAAWCLAGSRLYFLSPYGMYSVAPGERPVLVSEALPNLRGDAASVMGYDPENDALHVFTNVPATGGATSPSDWYVELDGGKPSFWPVSYATSSRPSSVCRMTLSGAERAAFMCADGSWRILDESVPCEAASKVAFGPFRISASDDMDGVIAELHASIAEGSANITATVYAANAAERAVKLAEAGTGGASFTFPDSGWRPVWRPRVRGAWCVVVLSCAAGGRWAFESMRAVCEHLGRLRP